MLLDPALLPFLQLRPAIRRPLSPTPLRPGQALECRRRTTLRRPGSHLPRSAAVHLSTPPCLTWHVDHCVKFSAACLPCAASTGSGTLATLATLAAGTPSQSHAQHSLSTPPQPDGARRRLRPGQRACHGAGHPGRVRQGGVGVETCRDGQSATEPLALHPPLAQ